MSNYHKFTVARATEPDPSLLLAQLRASIDPALGMAVDHPLYHLEKDTPWSGTDITSTQSILESAPAKTPQSVAQDRIDRWPIEYKALVLALIDETNRLRAALRGLGATGLPDITPQQAITAVRNKAGQL